MNIEALLIALSLLSAAAGICIALAIQAQADTARAVEHVEAFKADSASTRVCDALKARSRASAARYGPAPAPTSGRS